MCVSAEVEVLHNYDGEQDDELTIRVGDIISDVVKFDGGWWEGRLNGRKGVFPDNFVQVNSVSWVVEFIQLLNVNYMYFLFMPVLDVQSFDHIPCPLNLFGFMLLK